MSAPFTPAPWSVHVERESFGIARIVSYFVCTSEGWPEGQLARVNVTDELGRQEANTNLIAAAPELYEALASVLPILVAVRHTAGLLKTQLERIEKAKAALSRARGDQS